MQKPKRFLSLLVLCLFVINVVGYFWQIKPVQAAYLFSDGFESGNLSAWTSNSTGATLEVAAEAEYSGTYGLHAATSAYGSGSYTQKDYGSSYSTIYVQAYMNIFTVAMDADYHLAYLTDWATGAGLPRAYIGIVKTAGVFYWELSIYNTTLGDFQHAVNGTPTAGWHQLQMFYLADPSVGEAIFWLDGVKQLNLTGFNTDGLTTDSLRVGLYAPAGGMGANDIYVDDCIVDTNYIAGGISGSKFTFAFKDQSANDVASLISWNLYNGSQLLTYTQGQYGLSDGTYNLTTYYHGYIINQTDLDTATYGNTTITITLPMTSHSGYPGGYWFTNVTVASIVIQNQTSTNVTITGSYANPLMIGVDIQPNSTYVEVNSANVSGWSFVSNVLIYNATSFSSIKYIYSDTSIPPSSSSTLFSEFRGMYVFFTPGAPYSNNWTNIAKTMHDNGQNMILYSSYLLSWEPLMNYSGDWGWYESDCANAITACHAYGIKFILLYQVLIGSGTLNTTHPDLCSIDANGNPVNFFDPCNPTVTSAIKDQIEYFCNTFDIDGFCWDYIRYETVSVTDTDYSVYAKNAFEAWLGSPVTNWTDYEQGGTQHNVFMEWRVKPITDLVSNMRTWALAINANLSIGAAVATVQFDTYYPSIIRWAMGQDVSDWVMKGYLDWVSPMIYTDNVNNGMDSFQGMLRGCVEWYSAGPHGKVPLIPFIMADGHGWGGYVSPAISTIEVDAIRQYCGDGYILWQFIPTSGDTSYPQPYWDAYAANCTNGLFNVFGVTNVLATPSNETAVISWTTSSAATTIVNYASTLFFNETWKSDTLPSWSPYNSQSFNYWHLYNNVTTQSSSQVNMSFVTDHSITLSGLTPLTLYYFRFQSWDSYGNATSQIFTFFTSEIAQVTVTILAPTNITYSVSTVSVQLSASGGTIDKIWWNCKNGSSWIYGSNQTYTVPTSMTGFVNGTAYNFVAWANNTLGTIGTASCMFSVAIPYTLNLVAVVGAFVTAFGGIVSNVVSEVVPVMNVWGTWYNGVYVFALVPIICFTMAAICLLVNPKLALAMVIAGVISTLGVGLAIYFTAYAGNALSQFILRILF